MAEKRSYGHTEYNNACRTCLVVEAEFFPLNAAIGNGVGGNLLDCLRFTTRLENVAELPNYICTECSTALLVAYNFIQNATKAHAVLTEKLCGVEKNAIVVKEDVMSCDGSTSTKSTVTCGKAPRFRCKICSEKLDTKKSLKEHINSHMDIISYCCQLCEFKCKKRQFLSDHYTLKHAMQPTTEQLKAITKTPAQPLPVAFDPNLGYSIRATELQPQPFLALSNSTTQTQVYGFGEQLLQQQQQQLQQPQEDNKELVSLMSGPAGIVANKINVPSFNGDYSVSNDMKAADTEYVVMSDGTVEQVFKNGIIVKYMNSDELEPELVLNNGAEVDNATNGQTIVEMDYDDMIVEEQESEMSQDLPEQTNIEDILPRTIIQVQPPLNTECKFCNEDFKTPENLKIHMVLHNDIPHFFCDRCTYYTFYKTELMRHFIQEHNINPTVNQLLPKREELPILSSVVQVYTCDVCQFETNWQANIRRHYAAKHNILATEAQLRPTETKLVAKPKAPRGRPRGSKKQVVVTTELGAQKSLLLPPPPPSVSRSPPLLPPPTPPPPQQPQQQELEPPAMNTTNGIFTAPLPLSEIGDYFATYDGGGGGLAATTTVPLPFDAVPQIVQTDETVIANDIIEFDFNGDAMFADFDEDDDDGDGDEHIDELQNLPLTSSDELDEEELDVCHDGATPESGSYCAHCNKRFCSQYHFENHMFVHRNLAPYRCELCTNLYNMKRALIRHYRSVHKTMPTRDMIQPKGDKATMQEFAGGELPQQQQAKVEANAMYMCAKCPYESSDHGNLQLHLGMEHHCVDENYILCKLPYECPRCIRSFAAPARLQRHLERSHAPTMIVKQQRRSSAQPTAAAAVQQQEQLLNDYNSFAVDAEPGVSAGGETGQYVAMCMITGDTATVSHNSSTTANCVQHSDNKATTTNVLLINNTTTTKSSSDDKKNSISKSTTTTGSTSGVSTADSGPQKFVCCYCQHTYKSIDLFKLHMKRHIARNFACNHCPKKYISKQELRNHQLAHTGEMPHKCDICSKQFRYSHHLKRHKDIVHLGKRHRCAQCERTYATQAQLKIHAWTHNGHVPYKCPLCRRDFKKRELLRQHTRKVHNVQLTEAEIAEIYRQTTGQTNPHDFTVSVPSGMMLRRCDVEAAEALELADEMP